MKPKAKACDQPRNNDVPMEGTLRNGAAGGQSGAAGSRGIPSLSKSRFAKIRGRFGNAYEDDLMSWTN